MYSKDRNFKEKIWILGRARFSFLLVSISGVGFGVVSYLFTVPNFPVWITATIMIGLIISILVLILLYEEKLVTETQTEEVLRRNKAEIESLESKIKTELKDEAINMMSRIITYVTKSLRSVTDELRDYIQEVDQTQISDPKNLDLLKNRLFRHVCRDIRYVFEGDSRGVDTTSWPHNFFKIAIFEPNPSPAIPEKLVRTFYDYPEGIEPSSLTSIVDIKQHQRAAHVLAFLSQNIIVIENIKEENKKAPDVKRWVNLRENQVEDYESMVCVPIVSGIRGQPERQCLGVLVIDTNRVRYFLEERSFQAFLGNLLNPFRTILTFILEIKNYFSFGER